MDLMADLIAYNSSPEQVRARQARREVRARTLYANIGLAAGLPSAVDRARGESPVAELESAMDRAASGWNIPAEEKVNVGEAIGNQHPGAAALMVVRQALGDYRIPTRIELRYHGMKRASGHGGFAVDEGVVFIQGTLHSLSGPRHHVDFPVVVRAGRVLQPSVLIHQGTPRIITQHTLDDIIGGGEFTASVPDRHNMFAPPPEKNAAPSTRRVPLINPGMFKVKPSRMLINSAVRGVYAGDEEDEEADAEIHETIEDESVLTHRAIMELSAELGLGYGEVVALLDAHGVSGAAEQLEIAARGVRAFYSPDQAGGLVRPGQEGWNIPGADGSHLDVGERPVADLLAPGQTVTAKSGIRWRDRGAVAYTIPKGTRGQVVRDVDGAGRAYLVHWPELGYSVPVPAEALR